MPSSSCKRQLRSTSRLSEKSPSVSGRSCLPIRRAILSTVAWKSLVEKGLAVWRDRDINDKPLADPVGIAKAYLGLPIASLAADFLTIFALGVAVSFSHDPMGWILAGILLAGLFGSCGGGVVLLIIV